MTFLEIFFYCIKRFGWHGILLFIKLKLKRFNLLYIPGVQYPITLRNGTSDHSVFLQIFLKEEYFYSYDKNIHTIVDAGANAGYATIYFASLFPNAEIIAIEPELENFKLLTKNTKRMAQVKTFMGALWSSEST